MRQSFAAVLDEDHDNLDIANMEKRVEEMVAAHRARRNPSPGGSSPPPPKPTKPALRIRGHGQLTPKVTPRGAGGMLQRDLKPSASPPRAPCLRTEWSSLVCMADEGKPTLFGVYAQDKAAENKDTEYGPACGSAPARAPNGKEGEGSKESEPRKVGASFCLDA